MTSTWCLTRGLILSAALGAALVPLHGAAQQPAVPASGTPATLSPAAAAVVDIAGASGFIDVVGVKLGARLVDAITALRTYSPKMTFHAFAYQRYEALPKIDFGHTVMGRVRSPQYRQGYDDMEAVVMRVTLPPSPLLVWEVFRHVEWKHGTGPTSENVIAGLREKYGHETGTYLMDGPGPQLWWVYDWKDITSRRNELRKRGTRRHVGSAGIVQPVCPRRGSGA